MKKLLIGFLVAGSFSSFAAMDCGKELREVRKKLSALERDGYDTARSIEVTGENIKSLGHTIRGMSNRCISYNDANDIRSTGVNLMAFSREASRYTERLSGKVEKAIDSLEDCLINGSSF